MYKHNNVPDKVFNNVKNKVYKILDERQKELIPKVILEKYRS